MTSDTLPRINDDLYRSTGRRSTTALVKQFLLDRSFRPIVTLRAYRTLAARRAPSPALFLLRLAHRSFCHAAQLELPIETRVGPALQIAHGFGIVVNARAILGANVTLFHGVTIGQGDQIARDGTRVTGYPVIQDDVWIGPHATVVGGVTIGMGSRIMPGAVVNADVPPRSMVAGNPSSIIRQDCVPDVFRRVVLDADAAKSRDSRPAAAKLGAAF